MQDWCRSFNWPGFTFIEKWDPHMQLKSRIILECTVFCHHMYWWLHYETRGWRLPFVVCALFHLTGHIQQPTATSIIDSNHCHKLKIMCAPKYQTIIVVKGVNILVFFYWLKSLHLGTREILTDVGYNIKI